MHGKPTTESYSIFKNVFKNSDTKKLFEYDRYDMAGLFWTSKISSYWNDFFVKEHQECKAWIH